MNKVILIGTNNITTVQLARMLGEINVPFETILVNKGYFAQWSKYIKKCIVIDRKQLIPLLEEKKQDSKTVLVVHGDANVELLDANREKLQEHYILPLSDKPHNTTKYMDKLNVKQLAKQVGLNVVDAVILNKEDENFEQKVANIEFPCFTKAVRSSIGGKDDIFVCKDIDELNNAIQKARSNDILVEKFIDKKNELCFQGIAIGDEVYIPVVVTYIGAQVAGHYGGHLDILDANSTSEYVDLELMTTFVKEIGYQGPFSIEFILDKECNAYFMEINMRFGSYDSILPKVGFEVMKSWVEQKIEKNPIENKTAILEIYDFKHKVLGKHMSLWNWLKELKKTDIYIFTGIKKTHCLFLVLCSIKF